MREPALEPDAGINLWLLKQESQVRSSAPVGSTGESTLLDWGCVFFGLKVCRAHSWASRTDCAFPKGQSSIPVTHALPEPCCILSRGCLLSLPSDLGSHVTALTDRVQQHWCFMSCDTASVWRSFSVILTLPWPRPLLWGSPSNRRVPYGDISRQQPLLMCLAGLL